MKKICLTKDEVMIEVRVMVQMRLRHGSTVAQALRYASRYWLPEWQQAWARAHPGNSLPRWEGFLKLVELKWQEEGPVKCPPLPALNKTRSQQRGGIYSSNNKAMNRGICTALRVTPSCTGIKALARQVADETGGNPGSTEVYLRGYTTDEEWAFLRSQHAAFRSGRENSLAHQRVYWPEVELAMADLRFGSASDCLRHVADLLGMEYKGLSTNIHARETPEHLEALRQRFGRKRGPKPTKTRALIAPEA